MMITIRRMTETDVAAVQQLHVHEAQIRFVGRVPELLADASPTSHFHVVVAHANEETLVGFFNIDTAYANRYDFALPNELGLRSFLIGAEHQGRGYGKATSAELKPFLQRHYPNRDSLCLTVNCQNPAAYHAYLTGGFDDTGELYHGGSAGPQHIMRMSLRNE